MLITSSYSVEILGLHKPLKKTMEISRAAAVWLTPVIDGAWETLSGFGGGKKRFNEAEKLIHGTKQNRARYAFDTAFPKMPSYLRRAVLQHVIGIVSSSHTQEKAEQERPAGEDHYMPVFYRDNMYRKQEDRVLLKLYNGKDWVWEEVRLKKTDLDYLRKNWSDREAKSPVLVKRYKKYYLQFSL